MTAARPTILAIHPGALGDVVLLGHLLRRLGGEATLVAGGEKGRLLAQLGVVARAVDFDALPMHEAFADTRADRGRLGAILGRHDRLISFFGEGDAAAQQRLAALCDRDATFLPIRPPQGRNIHMVRLWMDMLGLDADRITHVARPPSGVGSSENAQPGAAELQALAGAPWPVPRGLAARAVEIVARVGIDPAGPYAVLHPGAGAAAKCWPLRRFVKLASLLAPRIQPLMALGPVEVELWDAAKRGLIHPTLPLLACPPLEALAAVLAGASLYIGNDSGVSHLAAALGTPVVAMFGPTRAEQFSPLGRRVATIQAADTEGITLQKVLDAAKNLLLDT